MVFQEGSLLQVFTADALAAASQIAARTEIRCYCVSCDLRSGIFLWFLLFLGDMP